jgi:hypothetical protein
VGTEGSSSGVGDPPFPDPLLLPPEPVDPEDPEDPEEPEFVEPLLEAEAGCPVAVPKRSATTAAARNPASALKSR